jgi:hypothetical protein
MKGYYLIKIIIIHMAHIIIPINFVNFNPSFVVNLFII